MSKHYDVAVLGAGLGALASAALLARRGWRVLLLGQGWRPEAYEYDGIRLLRRPFVFDAGTSPAWTRIATRRGADRPLARGPAALSRLSRGRRSPRPVREPHDGPARRRARPPSRPLDARDRSSGSRRAKADGPPARPDRGSRRRGPPG